MALKKLSTHKSKAKSLRKTKRKPVKKIVKKAKSLPKTPKKSAKKLSTPKNKAKSLHKALGKAGSKLSTHKNKTKSLRKTQGKPKKEAANFIGSIIHYFPHVQAAVIKLAGPLAIGETIKIKGHTTDLTQSISSMQMDRVDITNAKKGAEIGVQVSTRVRQGDKVYKQ